MRQIQNKKHTQKMVTIHMQNTTEAKERSHPEKLKTILIVWIKMKWFQI